MGIVPIQPATRQPPPEGLSIAEAAEWTGIVNRLPAGWFGREMQGLLAAFCRHIVESDRLSGMLAVLDTSLAEAASQGRCEIDLVIDSIKAREQLLRMRERETRAASSLATRLRLTPQSTYDKTNASRLERSSGPKPWERSLSPHELVQYAPQPRERKP
jgi:hypothetical protein